MFELLYRMFTIWRSKVAKLWILIIIEWKLTQKQIDFLTMCKSHWFSLFVTCCLLAFLFIIHCWLVSLSLSLSLVVFFLLLTIGCCPTTFGIYYYTIVVTVESFSVVYVPLTIFSVYLCALRLISRLVDDDKLKEVHLFALTSKSSNSKGSTTRKSVLVSASCCLECHLKITDLL